MGTWKTNAKQDGVKTQGAAERQKTPANGVMPGTGDVTSQENPRRERRQDYEPRIQPRETGVRY